MDNEDLELMYEKDDNWCDAEWMMEEERQNKEIVMAKGIIVVDIPESCSSCPLAYFTEESGFNTCQLTHKYYDPWNKEQNKLWETQRDNECPITTLPPHKEEHSSDYYEFGNLGKAWVSGYNTALNEIKGKNK